MKKEFSEGTTVSIEISSPNKQLHKVLTIDLSNIGVYNFKDNIVDGLKHLNQEILDYYKICKCVVCSKEIEIDESKRYPYSNLCGVCIRKIEE